MNFDTVVYKNEIFKSNDLFNDGTMFDIKDDGTIWIKRPDDSNLAQMKFFTTTPTFSFYNDKTTIVSKFSYGQLISIELQ